MPRGKALERKPIKRRPSKPRENEFSAAVKAQARRRAGGVCEFPHCHGPIDQHHHIQRRSQGGPGTLENCLCLCLTHHIYIHAHSTESYERGWLRHAPIRGS